MLKQLKRAENKKFYKFLLVGGINTVFGYSIFSLFIYIGIHYTIAVFLTTCIGILFNFKMFSKFVFNNTNNKLIIRFVGIYGIAYLLNISIIKISTYFMKNIYIAGGIATLAVAFVSYFLNKQFVFQSTCPLVKSHEKYNNFGPT